MLKDVMLASRSRTLMDCRRLGPIRYHNNRIESAHNQQTLRSTYPDLDRGPRFWTLPVLRVGNMVWTEDRVGFDSERIAEQQKTVLLDQ